MTTSRDNGDNGLAASLLAELGEEFKLRDYSAIGQVVLESRALSKAGLFDRGAFDRAVERLRPLLADDEELNEYKEDLESLLSAGGR